MIISIGQHEFRFYLSKQEKRTGICSKKYGASDKHILLWDFDNVKLFDIVKTLEGLQLKHNLPTIRIIQSSNNKYHAYCFSSRSFLETIHILSDTPQIDMDYFRLGIARGYFTLRISPRNSEASFKLAKVLWNNFIDEMSYDDVTINEYYTSNRGQHNV